MVTVEESKHDIQGFITSAYGHTYHSAYLFVRMLDVKKAKKWLAHLVPQIQTAESWKKDSNGEKIKPERIVNIAFSMEGLTALELSETILNSFPLEMQEGMNEPSRAKLLGDVERDDAEYWQVGGRGKTPFHFVLMLHAGLSPDDKPAIESFVEEISQGIDSNGMEIVYQENGYRRADDKEHFGYSDGIAQPKITGINKRDSDGKPITTNIVKTGEFIMGYVNQYGLYPSVPAVPVDEDRDDMLPVLPEAGFLYNLYNDKPLKDLGINGTYVVYRKLKQNVARFWNFLADEAQRLEGKSSPERMAWLGAKFVGRYPNGNPLVPDLSKLKHKDDFLYAKNDPDGMHCPFGSHIRRTNPRDVFFPTDPPTSLDTVDKHRILRRGRIFGDALFDLSLLDDETNIDKLAQVIGLADDGVERGLHFFGVNASIQMQFEFIQDSWSNNPHFNAMYQNKDPIYGDNDTTYQSPAYMHIPYEPVRIRTSPLPRFVSVLGGAYLFMPSITALKFLVS